MCTLATDLRWTAMRVTPCCMPRIPQRTASQCIASPSTKPIVQLLLQWHWLPCWMPMQVWRSYIQERRNPTCLAPPDAPLLLASQFLNACELLDRAAIEGTHCAAVLWLDIRCQCQANVSQLQGICKTARKQLSSSKAASCQLPPSKVARANECVSRTQR